MTPIVAARAAAPMTAAPVRPPRGCVSVAALPLAVARVAWVMEFDGAAVGMKKATKCPQLTARTTTAAKAATRRSTDEDMATKLKKTRRVITKKVD
mmetsp:Transcript_132244/g.257694  ORF Transcript_132244/g.257694 Transcript_132244/m.257694 type:complete len:96 (+) Transcript_132244:176-463(+)